jgi:hypothetical protein
MHPEVLTTRQAELLPLVESFSRDFYLADGTAIALTIGHRRSIDFDLFTGNPLQALRIKNQFRATNIHYKIIHEAFDQIHLMVDDVKLTFFNFPYDVPAIKKPGSAIKMPDLLTLAAMKTLALGGRAKWKDYVDMYFILKYHYDLPQVEVKATELFPEAFSAKLLRQQLAYFKDIDYSEKVNFLSEKVADDAIKDFLVNQATIAF